MRYTYQRDVDTRDNSQIFVLRIKEELLPQKFKDESQKLKNLGGYYSPFKKGFVFKKDVEKDIQKLYGVTEEFSIEDIKRVSIVSFCEENGIALKRSGKYYSLVEHDSLVINTENNTFIWNSKGLSGDIINFTMEYYNINFKAAIEMISRGNKVYEHHIEPKNKPIKEAEPESLKKNLQESKSMKNVYAYLLKTRKMSKETVQEFVDKGLIRQDKQNNIIFKTFDENNNLIAVSRKGTTPKFFQKIESESLNVGFQFNMGSNTKKAYFFEAPIDLMSYYEMNKENIDSDAALIAMMGLKYGVIEEFLKKNPSAEITVCVDNDRPGENFIESLKKSGIKFNTEKPKLKDWNEDLQEKKTADGYVVAKDLLKELNKSAKSILKSKESLKEFADFVGKLYIYSPYNQALIYSQNKNAVYVASKSKFEEEFGYSINPSAEPIQILVPVFKEYYQVPNSDEFKPVKFASPEIKEKIEKQEIAISKRLAYFDTGNVYDLSQTNAPKHMYPKILQRIDPVISNKNIDLKKTYQNLKKNIQAEGVQIIYSKLSNPELKIGTKGYATSGTIALNKADKIEHKICVLLHEYAHIKLHIPERKMRPRHIKEIEAETIAYAMGKKLGLDNSISSSKYVEGYVKKMNVGDFEKMISETPPKELKNVLINISKGMKETQNLINKSLQYQKEKRIENTIEVETKLEMVL